MEDLKTELKFIDELTGLAFAFTNSESDAVDVESFKVQVDELLDARFLLMCAVEDGIIT
jgi:hypothetical protein